MELTNTSYITYLSVFFGGWAWQAACGIFSSQPGIKPVPPELEVQSLNHWIATEVPISFCFWCGLFVVVVVGKIMSLLFILILFIYFCKLIYLFGEGNGDPLQYSCLENPMDGGAW